MKIWEQINETNWCRGFYAYDARKRKVYPKDPDAVKWCALGWLIRENRDSKLTDFSNTPLALKVGNISNWNDAPGRTWQEVRDVFKGLDL